MKRRSSGSAVFQKLSTAAKTALSQEPEVWQALSDGSGKITVCIMDLPQGKERWVIVHTTAREQAAKEQIEKKVKEKPGAVGETALAPVEAEVCL